MDPGGMPVHSQAVRPMALVRHGSSVTIDMYGEERIVTTRPGVRFAASTFDGTVPGPVIVLRQGDHLSLTLPTSTR